MRAFTERNQSERTAVEGEGGTEVREEGEGRQGAGGGEREGGGWGVVIACSLQALAVEREEKRKNKL